MCQTEQVDGQLTRYVKMIHSGYKFFCIERNAPDSGVHIIDERFSRCLSCRPTDRKSVV